VGSVHQLPLPAREAARAGDARPEATEAALVARAHGGDIEAWARLYHERFDRVCCHVAHLTGDAHAAEDLAQETFARAFVGLHRLTGPLDDRLRELAVAVVRSRRRSHHHHPPNAGLAAELPVPDFPAMLARARELAPGVVSAADVERAGSLAPVLRLARARRDDAAALAPFIAALRAELAAITRR
jgi:DNA-directed RNA polymerase specialized sigma24 family protein